MLRAAEESIEVVGARGRLLLQLGSVGAARVEFQRWRPEKIFNNFFLLVFFFFFLLVFCLLASALLLQLAAWGRPGRSSGGGGAEKKIQQIF